MSEQSQLNFNIPKIKRQLSKDNLRSVSLNSRDATELLQTIDRCYLDQEFRGQWEVKVIQTIDNRELEKAYREKRTEMKDDGRHTRELTEQFGFLYIRDSTNIVPSIAKNGLRTKPDSFSGLGDSKSGVYVCKHPDVQIKIADQKEEKTACILVFKITQGRCKAQQFTGPHEVAVEPTPNYDSHVSVVAAQTNTPHPMQLQRSQIYLYEYTDEALPSERPRHCLPYALLQYEKKEMAGSAPSSSYGQYSRGSYGSKTTGPEYSRKPSQWKTRGEGVGAPRRTSYEGGPGFRPDNQPPVPMMPPLMPGAATAYKIPSGREDPRIARKRNSIEKLEGSSDPRLMQGVQPLVPHDPRFAQNDPRMIQNDPRLMQNDPRLAHNDPRIMQNDPRSGSVDPRMFAQGDPRQRHHVNIPGAFGMGEGGQMKPDLKTISPEMKSMIKTVEQLWGPTSQDETAITCDDQMGNSVVKQVQEQMEQKKAEAKEKKKKISLADYSTRVKQIEKQGSVKSDASTSSAPTLTTVPIPSIPVTAVDVIPDLSTASSANGTLSNYSQGQGIVSSSYGEEATKIFPPSRFSVAGSNTSPSQMTTIVSSSLTPTQVKAPAYPSTQVSPSQVPCLPAGVPAPSSIPAPTPVPTPVAAPVSAPVPTPVPAPAPTDMSSSLQCKLPHPPALPPIVPLPMSAPPEIFPADEDDLYDPFADQSDTPMPPAVSPQKSPAKVALDPGTSPVKSSTDTSIKTIPLPQSPPPSSLIRDTTIPYSPKGSADYKDPYAAVKKNVHIEFPKAVAISPSKTSLLSKLHNVIRTSVPKSPVVQSDQTSPVKVSTSVEKDLPQIHDPVRQQSEQPISSDQMSTQTVLPKDMPLASSVPILPQSPIAGSVTAVSQPAAKPDPNQAYVKDLVSKFQSLGDVKDILSKMGIRPKGPVAVATPEPTQPSQSPQPVQLSQSPQPAQLSQNSPQFERYRKIGGSVGMSVSDTTQQVYQTSDVSQPRYSSSEGQLDHRESRREDSEWENWRSSPRDKDSRSSHSRHRYDYEDRHRSGSQHDDYWSAHKEDVDLRRRDDRRYRRDDDDRRYESRYERRYHRRDSPRQEDASKYGDFDYRSSRYHSSRKSHRSPSRDDRRDERRDERRDYHDSHSESRRKSSSDFKAEEFTEALSSKGPSDDMGVWMAPKIVGGEVNSDVEMTPVKDSPDKPEELLYHPSGTEEPLRRNLFGAKECIAAPEFSNTKALSVSQRWDMAKSHQGRRPDSYGEAAVSQARSWAEVIALEAEKEKQPVEQENIVEQGTKLDSEETPEFGKDTEAVPPEVVPGKALDNDKKAKKRRVNKAMAGYKKRRKRKKKTLTGKFVDDNIDQKSWSPCPSENFSIEYDNDDIDYNDFSFDMPPSYVETVPFSDDDLTSVTTETTIASMDNLQQDVQRSHQLPRVELVDILRITNRKCARCEEVARNVQPYGIVLEPALKNIKLEPRGSESLFEKVESMKLMKPDDKPLPKSTEFYMKNCLPGLDLIVPEQSVSTAAAVKVKTESKEEEEEVGVKDEVKNVKAVMKQEIPREEIRGYNCIEGDRPLRLKFQLKSPKKEEKEVEKPAEKTPKKDDEELDINGTHNTFNPIMKRKLSITICVGGKKKKSDVKQGLEDKEVPKSQATVAQLAPVTSESLSTQPVTSMSAVSYPGQAGSVSSEATRVTPKVQYKMGIRKSPASSPVIIDIKKPTEQEGFSFQQAYQKSMEEIPAMPLKKLGGNAIPVLGLTRGPSPTPPRQPVQASVPQTPVTPVSAAPTDVQAVNPPQWPSSFAPTSLSGQPLVQAGTPLVRSLLGPVPGQRLDVPFIPQQVRHPQSNLSVRLPVTTPLRFPQGTVQGQVRMPNMTPNVQHHQIQTNRFSQPPPTVPLQDRPMPGVLRPQPMPVRPPISMASQTHQSITVPPQTVPGQSFVRQQFQPPHSQGLPQINTSYPAPPPQGNSLNYGFPPVRPPFGMPPGPPIQGTRGVQVLGQPNQRLPGPHPRVGNTQPLQRPMFNPNQPPPGQPNPNHPLPVPNPHGQPHLNQPHLNQPRPGQQNLNHPPPLPPHLHQPPPRQLNPNQPPPTPPMNIRPISNLAQISTTSQPPSHEPKKPSHLADWFADMFAPKPIQKQRDSSLPRESTPEGGAASQEKQSYSREQTPESQSSLWSMAYDMGGGGGTPSSAQGNSTPTNTQGSFLGESSRDVHAGEAVQPGNDIKNPHSPSRRVIMVSECSPEALSSNFSSSPSPGQAPREKLSKKPLDDLSKEREKILNALQNLVSSTSDSEEGQEIVKREVFLPQTNNKELVVSWTIESNRKDESTPSNPVRDPIEKAQSLDESTESERSKVEIPDKSWDAASYRTKEISAKQHGSRDSSLDRKREIRDCSTERQGSRDSSIDYSPEKRGPSHFSRNMDSKGNFLEELEEKDLSRNRGMKDLFRDRTGLRDNSLDRKSRDLEDPERPGSRDSLRMHRTNSFSPERHGSRDSSGIRGMRDSFSGKPGLRESLLDKRIQGYSPERTNSRDSSRSRGTRDYSTVAHDSRDLSERPGSRDSSRSREKMKDNSENLSWDAASYRKSQDYAESGWSRNLSTERGQSIDPDDRSWDATTYRRSRDGSIDREWTENHSLVKEKTREHSRDREQSRERSTERETSTEYSDRGSTCTTDGSRSRDSSTDWDGRSRSRGRYGRARYRGRRSRSRSRSSSSDRYRRSRDYSRDRYRSSRNYSPHRYRSSRADSPDGYRRSSRYHSPDRYRRSHDYSQERYRRSPEYSPKRYRGSREYSPDDYKKNQSENKSRGSRDIVITPNNSSRGYVAGANNLSHSQTENLKDFTVNPQNKPSNTYLINQNRNSMDDSANHDSWPLDHSSNQKSGTNYFSDNQRRFSRLFSSDRNRTSVEHERRTSFCSDKKDTDVRKVEVNTGFRTRPQVEHSRQAFVIEKQQPYQTQGTSDNVRRVIRASTSRDIDSPTKFFKQSTDYHEDLAAELRRCSGEKIDATDTPDDYSSISGDSLEDLEDLNSNLVTGNKTSKEPGPRMPLTIESYLKFKLGVQEPEKVKERILWPLDTDLMVQSKNKRRRMVQKAKVVAAHYLKKLKTIDGMGCDSSSENNAEALPYCQEPTEMKLEDFSKDQILMELQIIQDCIKKCDELRKIQEGGALEGNVSALGNININLPGTSNNQLGEKSASVVKPPDRDLNRQRDALHQVSCDLMEAFQKLNFIGRPHQKIPEDILLKNEKNKYHSEEGCFLILLSAVSTKPHSRLVAMRKELERLHKMMLVAATKNMTLDVAIIQKKIKSIHSDRKKLMTTFTGSLGKKRLRKLNLVRTKYQVCVAYLKKELGGEEMKRLQYIAALHRSINTHIGIVHKELISPTL